MKVTLFGSFKATYWSYWSGTGYNFKDTDIKICLVGNIKVTKLTLLNYWQSRLSRLRMYQKNTILLLVCYLIIWRHSYWVLLVNTWLGISTPSNTYSCCVGDGKLLIWLVIWYAQQKGGEGSAISLQIQLLANINQILSKFSPFHSEIGASHKRTNW